MKKDFMKRQLTKKAADNRNWKLRSYRDAIRKEDSLMVSW